MNELNNETGSYTLLKAEISDGVKLAVWFPILPNRIASSLRLANINPKPSMNVLTQGDCHTIADSKNLAVC